MRLARLGAPGREIPTVVLDDVHYDLRPVLELGVEGLGGDIGPAFFSGDGISLVRAAVAVGGVKPLADAEQLRVGPPVASPRKIVCIGLNYRDHAEETGAPVPTEPVILLKDPGSIVGPFDDVLIPLGSTKTDWEVELAVVVGRTARYLTSPAAAGAHVAGYVLSHDVSEREFQLERGGQWDKGKSCETFNPLGPFLVTPDEIPDVQDLSLTLAVNGTTRQSSSTKQMIFGVDHVIWYLSQFMVLRPGDVINTGTPAGVAFGHAGQPFLRPGDVAELEITGLGRSAQTFRQATRD